MDEQETKTTLLVDIVRDISRERDRDAENHGTETASAYESFSLIKKAVEHTEDVSKDMAKLLKDLWAGVKSEDDTTSSAYMQEVSRCARESAMAWVQVAAMADKAIDSL